jgi:hypothetical protein
MTFEHAQLGAGAAGPEHARKEVAALARSHPALHVVGELEPTGRAFQQRLRPRLHGSSVSTTPFAHQSTGTPGKDALTYEHSFGTTLERSPHCRWGKAPLTGERAST